MLDRPTLVTGARGFAGGHLLERLSGERIVAWYRPGQAVPSDSGTLRWRPVDIRVRQMVDEAIVADGPARIYHLAGLPHVGAAWSDVVPALETNVLGTHRLLDAVRRSAVPCRILIISSAQVYAPGPDLIDETAAVRPATPYGVSKLAQEQLALRSIDEDHLEIIVARPFNHVGPRQDPNFAVSGFARQIAAIEAGLAEPTIRVGNLDTFRDITDVRDVVGAYERLMTAGAAGRLYNICSGRAVRIGDVLEELLSLSREHIGIEVDASLLRPNDPAMFVGDATRIRTELGWTPQHSLSETLHDTLKAWRRQVAAQPFA